MSKNKTNKDLDETKDLVKEAVGLFLTTDVRRLQKLIQEHLGEKIPIETIRDSLKSFDAIKRLGKIQRLARSHSSSFPNHKWYIDLIDLTGGGWLPSGWLLTVLDHYSRKAFAFYLKNKQAATVEKAFLPLYEKYKPLLIIADKGSEWAKIQKIPLSSFYLTTTKGSTAPIERLNRTLITKINLLFKLEGKEQWQKKLSSVLSTYNNTTHAATHQKPNDVFTLEKFSSYDPGFEDWDLKPGDTVRKVIKYDIFAKKSRQNKLGRLLTVKEKLGLSKWLMTDGSVLTSGQIQPAKGETSKESEQELEKHEYDRDQKWEIERIIKYDKRKRAYLVKWKGKDPQTGKPWGELWERKNADLDKLWSRSQQS